MYFSLILTVLVGNAEGFKPSGPSKPFFKPYDQRFLDRYSPSKYLGPFGPYSTREGNGISTETPAGCEIDQVVLLHRHGERYPEHSDFKKERKVIDKIYKSRKHGKRFSGDLEFLNSWEFFLQKEGDAGSEIETGPYAGTADLYDRGNVFRGRYGHSWDGQSSLPIFASGSERVVQSARAFGQGFFGYNYTDIAQLNIISEEKSVGANAISPTYCNSTNLTQCPLSSKSFHDPIVYPEFDVAAIRLNREHGLSLTGEEVIALFEVAAFDTTVNGDSPWLDVFTREEWQAYNYMMGIKYYCYAGGGSPIGRSRGMNWANATTTLLNQGPDEDGSGLPLILNFAHDVDITRFLGGMEILTPLKPSDPHRVTFDTRWDINDIVPMGAHLVIERLKCSAPNLTNQTNLINSNETLPESDFNSTLGNTSITGGSAQNYTTGYFPQNASATANATSNSSSNATEPSYFVRISLNDAVVPMDQCYDGPGYSCSLNDWNEIVDRQTKKNNFTETCSPEAQGVPSYVDFYWKYNHTTAEDTAKYIPWQGKALL